MMRILGPAIGLFPAALFALAFAPACSAPPQGFEVRASSREEGQIKLSIEPRVFALTIGLRLDAAGRKVLFNGGRSAERNDIASLVVGLFDNGTTAAPSLGYVYLGPAGSSPTGQTLANAAPTAYVIGAGAQSLENYLGTAGTGSTSSGYAITSDRNNLRRYLLRDFGDGSTFDSAETPVTFSNLPVAADGMHRYLVFAAAYDPALNNLGYTEAAVDDALTQGASTASVQLTLNLSRGVWTTGLVASPSLTPYRPSASGSLVPPPS